jgi:hypothetical protein
MAEEPKWGMGRDARGVHSLSRLEDGGPVRVLVTEQPVGLTSEPTLRDLSQALIAVGFLTARPAVGCSLPSGPTGRLLTAQGHPRAIFRRAIERGNLIAAEMTARELGRIARADVARRPEGSGTPLALHGLVATPAARGTKTCRSRRRHWPRRLSRCWGAAATQRRCRRFRSWLNARLGSRSGRRYLHEAT